MYIDLDFVYATPHILSYSTKCREMHRHSSLHVSPCLLLRITLGDVCDDFLFLADMADVILSPTTWNGVAG